MSNIRLQSPLRSFVNVDNRAFRNSPTRPSVPHVQIINLVDDDADANASPPAVRRRIAEPAVDDDVVLLDFGNNAGARSSSDTGRRVSVGGINRPIIIPDSDEENSPTRNAYAGPSSQRQQGDSYRIFSPPPPPPAYHPIPPVPSLPIIANPQPFAILTPPQALGENINSQRRIPFDEPHQPNTSSSATPRRSNRIQLGGGLVSHSIRAPRRGHQAWSGYQNNDPSRHGAEPPPAARIVTYLANNPQQLPQQQQYLPHIDARTYGAGGWFNQVWRAAATAFYIFPRNDNDNAIAAAASVPEYTKDMTHPGAPPPGWSFSFGTESVQSIDIENDISGSFNGTSTAELLACAMCLDPLYANVEERNDLTAEEKRRKRVWALRCGHMFDGKCIESLMVPNWQTEIPRAEEEEKKKIVSVDIDLSKDDTDEPASEDIAKKSEEKVQDDAENLVPAVTVNATPPPSTSTPVNDTPSSSQPESSPGNRYNLRTRRPRIQEQPSVANSSRPKRGRASHTAASSVAVAEGSSRKPRGTKRKHDGKVVKPEPTNADRAGIRYFWTCPVAGCSKMHGSYKVQDMWKPDEKDGPIAIYI